MRRADLLCPDEVASCDDASWFAARPESRLRFRRRWPGEVPQETQPFRCVLVSNVAPGVRLRRPIELGTFDATLDLVVAQLDADAQDPLLLRRLAWGAP